jgi:hypothetical protein
MNAVTTFDDAAAATDNAFPYVLVSSVTGAVVSLAAVWVWTAATFGAVVGA